MKLLFLIYSFLMPAVVGAQTALYYNWSGFPLEIYEAPSVKAKVLEKIPVGQTVKIIPGTNGPAYTIYLSYYGDTTSLKREGTAEINNAGSFYPLKTTWVKVTGKQAAGYTLLGFLSRMPHKRLHKDQEADNYVEIPVAAALKTFFGKPVFYRKQELKKETKEEIHFVEQYRFAGGVTYNALRQYVEKDGPGGEEHRIFLPDASLHEAVLFLLEITNAAAYRPEGKKNANKIKSRYDFFSWWYQPNPIDEKGNTVKDKNRVDFEYYAEGGSSSASFIKKNGGVEIVYSYGGC
ncbi:MAG: hypothetical protein J7599_13175 [Niabella sp.]|nr:hypothetical protein [Niabella sp.]